MLRGLAETGLEWVWEWEAAIRALSASIEFSACSRFYNTSSVRVSIKYRKYRKVEKGFHVYELNLKLRYDIFVKGCCESKDQSFLLILRWPQ